MSFVDVVVGTALVLIVFLALFGLLRASALISSVAKNKATAVAIANAQVEYLRSLEYNEVGTEGGIPSGSIPQIATTTENGLDFVVRTFIQYVDDPKDGLGASDATGITTDYKRAKVTVTYVLSGKSRDVSLVTNIAPPGLETTTGGGTLRLEIVGATGQPVPGASVRIQNPSLSPSVDVTAFSGADGVVLLPGAATSTDYRISVSKNGYSSAQTYARDAQNQNPSPGYLTVAQSQTTTATFAIDVLGTFVLRLFSPIESAVWSDMFGDASSIASQSSVVVSGGAVTLAGDGAGGYVSSGSVASVVLEPEYLAEWANASTTASVPGGTSLSVQVLDGNGALLPESVLPGNASGFTGTVPLSGVATTTYPALALRATLASSISSFTPSLEEWRIGFKEGPLPRPDTAFTLTGAKAIGSTGAGAPIYKTVIDASTDAEGVYTGTLEWDVYDLVVDGLVVLATEPLAPYPLDPASTTEVSVILE